MANLNVNTSIVDYLKNQGRPSTYEDRKKIAKQLGIKNYTGTADQNTKMLKLLKGKATTQPVTPKKPSTTTKSADNQKVTAISGADQNLVDKANSQYTQSDAVTNAQKEAQESLDKVKELSSITDIIDQDTWDAINNPFTASSAYQDAMDYTNSLLEQLSSGRTSYTDQIRDMMNQIMNREDFQYDVSQDTLFQQSLASAMASGQTAMKDTIGQASALTGGYASTYATSAGNQTYNAFIQDAYSNLPEYYQMALEAYQMEGQEMYDQLAMLNDADATEFQRMYDSWSANFANAQQMYQNEYGAWQDSVNNAYNSANLQLQEHGQLYDYAYNTYSALQNNANTMYAQEYQRWADEVANAMQYMNMQNADYWNTQNFNEEQRQFDESLEWDKEQFVSRYDVNGDGKVDSKDIASSGGSGSDLKDPTETQMSKALEAYNSGGMDALNQYINSIPSTYNRDAIAEYVGAYGNYDTKDNPLPLQQRTFTIIDDGGINWGWGVDNNVVVEDQYGNRYRLGDLKKEDKDLEKKLSNKHLKEGQTFTIN